MKTQNKQRNIKFIVKNAPHIAIMSISISVRNANYMNTVTLWVSSMDSTWERLMSRASHVIVWLKLG